MTMQQFLGLALVWTASLGAAGAPQAEFAQAPARHVNAPRLVEPKLTIDKRAGEGPAVALTFDACMGKVDERIFRTLIEHRIPSTIFVTARWLKRNPQALAEMRAHPDLFEIEDHGENHIPAVDVPTQVYGIAAAGSPEAVSREVEGGAAAIQATGAPRPQWFRGATAKYTPAAIEQIQSMGYRIAGYSINGDSGSLLGAAATERQYRRARDGDVIISHINQPSHAAGEGVVKGMLDLKARGFRFVRLRDRTEVLAAKGF